MATILWSAQFHVGVCTNTALPIVLRLRDRGHTIVVQSIPAAERQFGEQGFEFIANSRFPVYDFGTREALPAEAADGGEGYQRWWRSLVRLQIEDTLDVLAGERCDLVFGGSCMQLCGHGIAAERAGVPWVSYIDFLVDETSTREPEFPALWDRWRATLGLAPERRPPSESLWFPFSPQLILYLVHPGLAFGAAPAYVQRVGNSVWDPPASGEIPGWVARLGVERPAVLVSTSSLWQDDLSLVTNVALALADCDIDVVATIPTDDQMPALPNNVVFAGPFPHTLLMARVASVVCSAGLGTVTRALCAGVPVVAVPRSGDGYNVARAVARCGAGVAVGAPRADAAVLGAAVQRTLSDQQLRRAAAGFASELVSQAALDRAADAVEALLRIGARP